MNMNPWKDQTDVINGFDVIRKIEGSVIYEQVCTCNIWENSKLCIIVINLNAICLSLIEIDMRHL